MTIQVKGMYLSSRDLSFLVDAKDHPLPVESSSDRLKADRLGKFVTDLPADPEHGLPRRVWTIETDDELNEVLAEFVYRRVKASRGITLVQGTGLGYSFSATPSHLLATIPVGNAMDGKPLRLRVETLRRLGSKGDSGIVCAWWIIASNGRFAAHRSYYHVSSSPPSDVGLLRTPATFLGALGIVAEDVAKHLD